ncbi:MAG: CopG family antitoxin [Ktedonobacteraceae bacterium]
MKKKQVFQNQDEEREFYDNLDYASYLADKKPISLSYPNLKASKKPISIRLPGYLINAIKEEALQKDIPYQALIREALKQRFVHNQ